jgi:hypothetical protein
LPHNECLAAQKGIQFNTQMPGSTKNTKLKINLPKKYNFSLSNIPFLKLVIISLVLNLITIIVIFLGLNKIPPQVPLFYGYARGDKQLSSSSALIIPSLISIGIILTNTSVSLILTSDYLKRILIVSSLLVTALSLVTTIKIILLVGNF